MTKTVCDNCGKETHDPRDWWVLGRGADEDFDLCSARCVEAMGARLGTSAESP